MSTRQAMRVALAAAIAAGLALVGCAKNSPSVIPPYSPSGVTAPPPAHTLYVADEGSGSNFLDSDILLYDASALGGAPYGYIGGFATHMNGPWDVTTDSAGNIWVANFDGLSTGNGASITEYKAGAQGDAQAITYLIGSNTTFVNPSSVRIDAAGTIYVTDFGTNQIDIFAKGSNGNVAPKAIIGGSNTTLSLPYNLAIDSSGNVWVANRGAGTVVEFASGLTGNVAPTNILTGALCSPRGIWFDSNQNFWVEDACGSIQEYAGPAPTGNVQPILNDTNTGLSDMRGSVVVDSAGNVFAANTGGGVVGIYPGLASQSGGVQIPFTATFTGMQHPRHMWVR